VNQSDARANLLEVMRSVVDEIKAAVRDKREPGRLPKQKAEDKLYASVRRHFKRQADKIRGRLEILAPERKAIIDTTFLDDDSLWDDPDWDAELVKLLTKAAQDGISLFADAITIGMDYTATNTDAAKWARQYTYDLIKGIDDTTREAVRSAISGFIETPGMTIGDVMDALPYGEIRAQMIATTEITRSYAQGNQLAGEAMKKEWPDVEVVKKWYTNNDDRVCDICGPMDGEEVPIDEPFSSGDDQPPAHVNCRCWTASRTRIGEG
jgi:SPP1 gp7 family putative phage head morphogenesis protein